LFTLEISGSAAADFLQGSFSGIAGLPALILQRPIEDTKVFALVPLGTTIARALEFRTGGLCSVVEMQKWLCHRLNELSKLTTNATFLVQDIWAKTADYKSTAIGTKQQAFEYLDHPFLWLSKEHFTFEEIRKTLQSTITMEPVSAFCDSHFGAELVDTDLSVDPMTYKKLMSSVREIYISAYDGESILVLRV
jgi:hypothetical protein